MNVRVLFVVVLGLLACPKPGHAESEKVKTNQSTKLYRRAGEQSPVILTVKSGQTVTLVAKDGRWLRVRVSGRTGWIPRSKVDLPEGDDDIVRNTRRRPFVDGRSTKRGFGGEAGPDDRVGADATGDGDEPKDGKAGKDEGDAKVAVSKPAKDDTKRAAPAARGDDDDEPQDTGNDDGEPEPARQLAHVGKPTKVFNKPEQAGGEAFVAEQKTVLYVGRTKGTWTRVSTEDGDAGWVATSQLDMERPEAVGGPRTRMIYGRGRLGVSLLNQSVATAGATRVPDNYTAASPMFTVALGGTAVFPFGNRLWIGGDLAYDFNKSAPGIDFQRTVTEFIYHNLNARAVVGYDLLRPSGLVVFGRLGLHYDAFQVAAVADFVKNPAKLPNQTILAPTIGAAVAMPRLTNKLGIMVSADAIVAGSSVAQTKNLEDGTGPSATAVYAGASAAYHLTRTMDIQVTYDFGYTMLSFSGMPPAGSARGHTGTGVSSGTDLTHAVSAGIAYGF